MRVIAGSLTAFACCASAARARADHEACTSTIDGHVVDAATHEPVPGAAVRLDGRAVAESDGDGRFVLRDACPGPRAIEIERADYGLGRRAFVLAGKTSLEIALQVLEGEVVIVEAKAPAPTDMRATTVVSGEALERTRGRSFSDALAEVPGVSQLRSASGLAKPIVRGQFGRRLLILVDGIRHRSQDWGLDHAPELDPFIADKLTVVRGASGVRHGPDAIGGAVLADPPDLPRAGHAGEAHLIGTSNGHGGSFAGRVRSAFAGVPGLAVQLEGTFKRLAAPSTPDYPLDNTGSSDWSAGATVGHRAGRAEYRLSYMRYQARLGVCSCLRIDSSEDFLAQLAAGRPRGAELFTSELEIERPYQAVAHDLAIARGRRRWDGLGTISATYAFQHDHRREYDVVRSSITGPQFNFQLMTNELGVTLEHDPVHVTDHLHLRGAAGGGAAAQHHRFSGLPLIPDYRAWSGGIYAIERLVGHAFELEAGVRYDLLARTASLERQDFLRLVRSGQLALDACGTGARDPVDCASRFRTLSASIGGLVRLTGAWSAKLDLSTASRPPNTDEQYLNGTAPTFPVLGLGDPELRPETTYSASLTTTFQTGVIAGEASVYANAIDDYIYFAPAIDDRGAPIFDVLIQGTFPRFVTRPIDARFYGVDGGVAITPSPAIELGAQVAMVRAENARDGSYLVFVPPDRLRGSATLRRASLGALRELQASISGTYTARQHRFDLAADLAPPPAAYFQLGAELGAERRVGGHALKLALQGTNLLNARSRDYTSLLRYFADQPGRQLMLRLSVHFSSPDLQPSKGT